jgi:N utilization substance protein A
VDIRSETEFAAEEAEHAYEEEEVQGRCAAILSNGRRCPNAALSGSRYCGLESHQALAQIDSDKIADLAAAASPPEQAGSDAAEAAPEPAGAGGAAVAEEHAPEPAHAPADAGEAALADGAEPAAAQQTAPEAAEGQAT